MAIEAALTRNQKWAVEDAVWGREKKERQPWEKSVIDPLAAHDCNSVRATELPGPPQQGLGAGRSKKLGEKRQQTL